MDYLLQLFTMGVLSSATSDLVLGCRMTKLLTIVAFSLASCLGFADEFKRVEYSKINAVLQYVHDEVKSPMAQLNTRVNYSGEGEIKAWLEGSGLPKQPLPIDSNNNITLPLLTEAEANALTLVLNQPEQLTSLSVTLFLAPPTENEMSYQTLFSCLDDINGLTKKMAGGMSWLTPTLKTLQFHFGQPATITMTADGKATTYRTDETHSIELKRNKRVEAQNPMVTFSRRADSVVTLR